MRIPMYQIDAFTDSVFSGNPAAVCPLPEWPDDALLQAIAAENNLSETAFLVPRGNGYDYELRWFTPATEVDLCGHATLAAAHVVFNHLAPSLSEVAFDTRSGVLTVWREDDRLSMAFPALPPAPCDCPDDLLRGLGQQPKAALRSNYYLAVFESEDEVRALRPRMDLLARLDLPVVIATARSIDSDFVSRCFGPKVGIPEDPVTGSAHCVLAPYWGAELGKTRLHARQISARGGELWCELAGDRVLIAGRAAPFLRGEIEVPWPATTSMTNKEQSMDNRELKEKIRSAFDQAAAGYDRPALRFFSETGERLADHMCLSGGEHILDVASGTGAAALACARRLSNGSVTGIDLSEAMLDQARAKAARNRLPNLRFQRMDIEALAFPADAFDGACCSFGIFFLPDMAAGLRKIAAVVKPGGRIGVSSFTEQVFEPLVSLFFDRVQQYGATLPPLSWKRLDHPDKHRSLYESAGLVGIETHRERMGYYLEDAEGWWDILWNSGFRGLLNQLSPAALATFRQEHLREIAAHATGQGIWLEMEALITVGRKPGA